MLTVSRNITLDPGEFEWRYSRSSGPGGQHVNKTNTKVSLIWDPEKSPNLPDPLKKRFLATYANRLRKDGCIVIQADRHRDQSRNQQDCLDRLRELLLEVLHPPKQRRRTKPSKRAVERRLDSKKRHGQKKQDRRKAKVTNY